MKPELARKFLNNGMIFFPRSTDYRYAYALSFKPLRIYTNGKGQKLAEFLFDGLKSSVLLSSDAASVSSVRCVLLPNKNTWDIVESTEFELKHIVVPKTVNEHALHDAALRHRNMVEIMSKVGTSNLIMHLAFNSIQ